jgi:hypothetical protein
MRVSPGFSNPLGCSRACDVLEYFEKTLPMLVLHSVGLDKVRIT